MKKIMNRIQLPTPKFFCRLRNLGLTAAAVGAAVIASPVALPAVLIKIAGYLAVAGSVAGSVSQVAVKGEEE